MPHSVPLLDSATGAPAATVSEGPPAMAAAGAGTGLICATVCAQAWGGGAAVSLAREQRSQLDGMHAAQGTSCWQPPSQGPPLTKMVCTVLPVMLYAFVSANVTLHSRADASPMLMSAPAPVVKTGLSPALVTDAACPWHCTVNSAVHGSALHEDGATSSASGWPAVVALKSPDGVAMAAGGGGGTET